MGVCKRDERKVVSTGIDSPHRHMSTLNKKVPHAETTPNSKFYWSPLTFTPLGSRPWSFSDPYAKRKLQSKLNGMCPEANVEGNFNNHSLRATGTTALFDAGCPRV